jgi:hypothetical protein
VTGNLVRMDSDEGQEPDGASADETDALISRLRVIESQPLESRAEAFSQIYDSLQSILGGGDGTLAR